MADQALLAAMKLRQQQKAEEDAARAHAEEMARQSVTDQTMSPWATMGQGAMDWASDYANKVGEAAAPQIERAKQGFLDLVGSSPVKTSMGPIADIAMGAGNKIARGQGADAANKLMDTGFGALNTAFSPLAPPMEAVLKPALESETGQGFVQGLDALGTGIEDATGISKQNQLDAAMWLGAPVAGHYAAKPFNAMAKRIVDADAVGALGGGPAHAQPVQNTPVGPASIDMFEGGALQPDKSAKDWFAEQRAKMNDHIDGYFPDDGSGPPHSEADVDALMKYYTDRGAEHVAKHADPKFDLNPPAVGTKTLAPNQAGLDAYFAAQKRFERQKALNEIDRKNGGNTDLTNVEPLLRDGEPRGQTQSVEARMPQEAEPKRPETGAEVAQAYRDWAKKEGATIDDALAMLDDEKSAWEKDLYDEASNILAKEAGLEFYDQSRTPLYNQISAKQKVKSLTPLEELDGVSPRMTPQSARDDYASSGTAWQTPRKDGAGFPIKDEPRGQPQRVEAKAPGLADIKVKPGSSIWDTMQQNYDAATGKPTKATKPTQVAPKSFQAGDDFLRQAKAAAPKPAPNVPRTVTIMPEGMQDGRSSGARNVEIVTSPTVQDLAKAADRSSYGEARFLIEPDGVIHTWTADAGWHADMGEFLGADVDGSYRGLVTARDIRAAQASGAKTLTDVIEFTQTKNSRGYWDNFKTETGLSKNPEWAASEQALVDSYSPKGQAKRFTPEDDKLLNDLGVSPVEQLDSGAIDQPAPKLWKDRRADKATAMLDDQRNQSMPRKKGEAVFEPTRGYTERQAKLNSPLNELDNPRPMDGEIAAARARSAEFNAYKAEQPPATKPERAADMKQRMREEWLNPDRPTTSSFVDKPLPSITTAAKKADPAFVKTRDEAFPVHEGDITPKTLADKVSTSLQDHIAMTPEQRRINLRAAEKRLLDYMPNLSGRPSEFMNENKKLMKTRIGYDGGEPVTLPNGQGIESTGLSLSPSTEMKGFKTCPNSAACREACLGLKSGQYYLGGEEGGPQVASRYRTTALLSAPEAAAVKIFEEIAARRRKAVANGNVLGVRMNVLSDVDPKVWKPIIEHFNDVIFYDYTKMKYEPIAPNHHYTYSSTGVSSDMVSNKNTNWSQMRNRLDAGDNVAMAFSTKEAFPKWVVDEESGKRYRVVDGVSHDFRPIDLQDASKEGVIVGLKNMDLSTKEATADISSGGFIVKYEPNWKREGKTGKGKMSRDEQGNPIAQNDTVYIQAQPSKESTRSAKPGESGTKTGPQTQIKIGGEDRTPATNVKSLALEDFDTPGPFAQPKKRNPPSAYSKLDRKRKAEAKKKQDQDVDDVAQRMYARLHMQDHAPKIDKTQKRKLWEEEYPEGYQSALNHDDLWPHGKRVEVDIDGDPIHPDALIFGRQQVGSTDKNQAPRKIREMAEAMMKVKNPKAKVEKTNQPGSREGGHFRFSKGMRTGDTYPEGITINSATPEWLQDQTLAHEAMHGIDFLGANASKKVDYIDAQHGTNSKKLDARSIHYRNDVPLEARDELFSIYEEVNENFGRHANGKPNSPENNGYPKHMTQAELIAEAGRLYMMDPGYIKAKFPHAAAYLRKIVKENPDVSKHVHFNEMGGGLAGVMAAKYLAEQQQGNR